MALLWILTSFWMSLIKYGLQTWDLTRVICNDFFVLVSEFIEIVRRMRLNEHVHNKTTNFRVGILHRSRRVQKGGGLAGNLRWVCTMAVKFKSFETHVSA